MSPRGRSVLTAALLCTTSIAQALTHSGTVYAEQPREIDQESLFNINAIVTDALVRAFNPLSVIQVGLEENANHLVKQEKTYTVQRGDYLEWIAEVTDVSVDRIMSQNGIEDPNELQIGQVLNLPERTVHHVKEGDSLEAIAKLHDVQLEKLVAANQSILMPASLFIGQIILIPEKVTRAYIYRSKTKTVQIASRSHSTTMANVKIEKRFAWPLEGMITSSFGKRWGEMHLGIDISNTNKHAPILAAADGVVTTAGNKKNGYGQLIIIDHGDGVETWYAHLSKIAVNEGADVKIGDTIGQMGSTGDSTGSHLHFEIRSGGAAINPTNYLPAK